MLFTKVLSAIGALGLAIAGCVLLLQPSRQRLAAPEAPITRETLPDGSVVELTPGTVIDLRFERSDRIIHLLRGSMDIDVARDPQRPLTVATAHGVSVIAIGTQFSVRSHAGATDIDVREGTVKVVTHIGASSARQRDFILHGGQDAAVTSTGDILQGSWMRPINEGDWPEEIREFNGSRLKDVATAFNAHRKYPLRIEDAELANIEIDGVFDVYNPIGLLDYLKHYRGIEAKEFPDGSLVLQNAEPR